MDKIAIIGLGLIGGSIGLALKSAKRLDLEIVGHDIELRTAKKAVKRGAVDRAAGQLYEAVERANMVILAVPVMTIREMLEAIADMVSPGCVVTDTGSTKEAIMTWATEYLPKEVNFVGGHPMAGREASGIDAADATLFQGARYAVIPDSNAREDAVRAVLSLVDLLGARPLFPDAFEHDSYVAAVSHLPMVLSSALVTATAKSASWDDMSKLAATGFRDVTRLASGDPIMSLDICLTNRDGVLYWIDEAIKELLEYRRQISAATQAGGSEEALAQLAESFARARYFRQEWLARFESGRDQEAIPTTPSGGKFSSESLPEGALNERYKPLVSLFERQEGNPRRRRLRQP